VKILVTGGAGYIGSHVANDLVSLGHDVTVIDDLSTGFKHFLPKNVKFERGSTLDFNFLMNVMSKFRNSQETGVIHLAGLKFAGLSVSTPLNFYQVNTVGTINLLAAMNENSIQNLVFSSSCSVYGSKDEKLGINEDAELSPLSPYGRSKFYAESIIADSILAYDIKATCLRYFNVIGNTHDVASDRSLLNLLPNIYNAITSGTTLKIFGNDYGTEDGTCVRDYVDVGLLSKAHVTALDKLVKGEKLKFAYNLGSGSGYSVLQIVETAKTSLKKTFRVEFENRRKGDPSSIFADVSAAKIDLSWENSKDLSEMISAGFSAWQNFEVRTKGDS
jgi:UDP-glucose 4-epimerase